MWNSVYLIRPLDQILSRHLCPCKKPCSRSPGDAHACRQVELKDLCHACKQIELKDFCQEPRHPRLACTLSRWVMTPSKPPGKELRPHRDCTLQVTAAEREKASDYSMSV